ncbi:9532_t:CDS:1, partial [Scutellospora calospora]
PNTLEYCLAHTEASIVIVSKSFIKNLLNISHKLPALKAIITIDPLDGLTYRSEAIQKNILLYEFTQIEKFGQQHFKEHVPSQPDDLLTIMYTSGTTGIPKGVMLSHSNIMATLCPIFDSPDEEPGSRVISYLPMAHIYGLMMEVLAINLGFSVGYFSGSTTRLFEDVRILQPISFPSVPKIFMELYQSIRAATIDAPGVKGEIARQAYQKKLAHFKKTG